jgi:hypothetical protein
MTSSFVAYERINNDTVWKWFQGSVLGPGCMAADRRYIARLVGMVRGRWRGGRVAEGARLESVYTGNRIVGSNPTLSAKLSFAAIRPVQQIG